MKEREETEEYERGEKEEEKREEYGRKKKEEKMKEEFGRKKEEEEKENEEEADDLWSNLLVLSVKQISLLGNIVQEIIV